MAILLLLCTLAVFGCSEPTAPRFTADLSGPWHIAYSRLEGGTYACVMQAQDVTLTLQQNELGIRYYEGILDGTRLQCSGPDLSLFDYTMANFEGNTRRSLGIFIHEQPPSADVSIQADQLLRGGARVGTLQLRPAATPVELSETHLSGEFDLSISFMPFEDRGFVVHGTYELARR